MLRSSLITKKLVSPFLQPLNGVWFRGINLAYIATPLQFSHTDKVTTRFHHAIKQAINYPLLYLAENPIVTLQEINAQFCPPGTDIAIPNTEMSSASLSVKVFLKSVLDLTDEKVQRELQTNFQELTGDWMGYDLRKSSGASVRKNVQIAPTQELGLALYRISGLMGLLTISAEAPTRKNLVIFPDKIKLPTDGKIEFVEPSSGKIHQIP